MAYAALATDHPENPGPAYSEAPGEFERETACDHALDRFATALAMVEHSLKELRDAEAEMDQAGVFYRDALNKRIGFEEEIDFAMAAIGVAKEAQKASRMEVE